jgi:predicted amidohydrolase/GNAT superfamily N-acetyltransferase
VVQNGAVLAEFGRLRKKLYIITKPKQIFMSNRVTRAVPETKISLRNLKIEDYEHLSEVMKRAYASMGGSVWKKEQIEKLLEIFPDGQICVELNGKPVACALSLIIDYSKFTDKHTYAEITGDYAFSTFDSLGDTLYGIDVFVDPEHRGLRLGRRLYDARKELCEKLNLRSIIAGGRIPGYKNYSDKLSPKEYIEKVKRRELYDPILTFQISNDFHVKKILTDYLPTDNESKTFATLIEWHNIYYEEKQRKLIGGKQSVVRIGVVQWQMRNVKTLKALMEQAEFFIDAVSGYESDFALFPELFNAPLLEQYNDMPEPDAMRSLASQTSKIVNKFCEFAVSYNINIITGSLPYYENGQLYNVAYLCRRDGSVDSQYKIHITPNEAYHWGLVGGSKLKIFDTDAGRIGILICYDVEFPELSRLLADKGMEILFVPFLTDTQKGYNRVKKCAQARAIENECYVVVAGSVGNLPKVKNMDIQFAQSAVYSPSDFAFPNNATIAEATPNTEMTLICDVDRDLLKELHTQGSVRILKDRRKDLYELKWKNEEE